VKTKECYAVGVIKAFC